MLMSKNVNNAYKQEVVEKVVSGLAHIIAEHVMQT